MINPNALRIANAFGLYRYGPSRATRTPGILLPNRTAKVFLVICGGFWDYPLGFTYFPDILFPRYPRVPDLSVVKHVVKRRLPAALHGAAGSFSWWLGWVYCNSAWRVMQLFYGKVVVQKLHRNRQRKRAVAPHLNLESERAKNRADLSFSCFIRANVLSF